MSADGSNGHATNGAHAPNGNGAHAGGGLPEEDELHRRFAPPTTLVPVAPGWTLGIVERRPDLAQALSHHADRAEHADAAEQVQLLREAMLVLAPWCRRIDPEQGSEWLARVSGLVARGSVDRAALELLPSGSACRTETNEAGLHAVRIAFAERAGEIFARARSLPAALVAALFRALARHAAGS